jgi:beta-lactamase regulating signal transducer with metallopeptidase domain
MFTTLADAALKGIVLLVVIALLAVALRRASAARRHLVWLLGVVGLLVLPLLSAALPAWRVHMLPQWLAVASTESPAPVATHPAESRPVAEVEVAPVIPLADTQPIEFPSASEPTVASPAVAMPEPRPIAWSAWLAWLVPLWAIGALIALAPTLAGLWQLARLRAGARPLAEEVWRTLLGQSCAELKVRQPVRLLCSRAAAMPLTFGAWRPVLLVPADAVGWPTERRRLVLLHELAHIRRWDWLTQMLAHAACAVHWFNPLAWLAARRMQTLREQACDDLVLACGARASDYARELLAIAANQHERPLLALAAVPMARRSALEVRVRAVLDSRRSRAALTAATSLFALLLLAAVLVPLAMLQAAGPQKPAEDRSPGATPAEKPVEPKPPAKADTVKPRDPTPEELEARKTGIRLSVLNAKGDQGIAEFRVIAGVPAPGIADEYEKRTGKTAINWQPHTLKIGKDGEYVWPLAKAYEEMALRVEADGYVPSAALWLKKSDGPQHVVFMLHEDSGVKGRVLQPDGRPAVGATIALAMPQRDAVWEDGRLRGSDQPLPEKPADRWRLPIFVTTDAAGRFQLPTEPEAAAVLIVHDSGVRELAFEELQKSPAVKLQGWGRIEGRVLWKDMAGAGEPISLSVHRDDYGYPGMVASYAKVQSNAGGRFALEKVLPGLVQLSRSIPVSPTDPNAGSMNFPGLVQHVQVKAGDPTAVVFGGQGRKVTGKLTGRDSWEGVTFHFHPNAPHVGFPGDDDAWKAFGEFQKSAMGPLFFRDKQPVNADGTFTIENMLPGTYQIFFSAPGAEGRLAYSQITVEPEVAGKDPPPQDLGEIPVKEPAIPPGAKRADPKPARAAAPPTKLDALLDRVRQAQRGPFGGNPIVKNERGEIVGLGLAEFELQPGDAAIIGQLPELSRLSLQRSNVTDEDLQQFKGLKKLTALNLWDAKISDAGVAAIAELSALQTLQLGGTGITDDGLKSVAKLNALRELDLARTKITDAGLKSLSPLWKLEGLKLAETSITDAGLPARDKLPALRGITLDETQVTAAGLERLAMRVFLNYLASDKLVAAELAERMSRGDAVGVDAMLSIGVDLPHAGTFKTRSIAAHPLTPRDTERQRQRFRIEWDWNNNGKNEGLFAEIAVRQGSPRVIEAGVLEAAVQAQPKPEAKTVTIRGKAVDDETGKPVAPLIVQAGKFDPADPTKVTWGFSEGRSSATDGSFSTTIRWGEGWTARILADGYLPQPVLTKAPPEDKSEIEVLVRLKRGRLVRGQVLDHNDKPVKGASVFAVGPTGVNIAAGKAWSSWGEEDPTPKPVLTDDAGRFEIAAGEAKKLAVSGVAIDAWPADIAAEGDTIVKLPEPAKVEIQLDIDGAEKESQVFLQLLVSHMKGFEGVRLERTLPIANGGKLTLAALTPGKYQFCRTVTNRLGMIGTGAMLEREFLELKPGETKTINYVRDKGARVRGQLALPAEKLMGIVVQISSEKAEKDPFDGHEWTTTYASQTANADGSYLTERLAPGAYSLSAQAYVPLTPEQQLRTGLIRPTYGVSARIEVPESGELVVPELKLEKIR